MDKYNEYLAVQVLNEKEIVTYRTLSRALKVHVNLAKQMLWDFHNRQNTKKLGSVHATYLLSGRRKTKVTTSTKSTQLKSGDNMVVDSSPPLPSSSMPMQDESQAGDITPTRSILLVKEEHLEKARTTFVEPPSIHIYSLQSEGLSSFQTLTDCTRKIFATLRTEDPMKTGKQYGTIQNAYVKRRSQKTPIPASTIPKPPAAASKTVTTTTTIKKEAEKPKIAEIPSETENQRHTASKAASKPSTIKRQGSDIAASFAKNAGKPKVKPAEAVSKKQEVAEDTPMAGISDDEPDDEAPEPDIDIQAPSGKSKQDRQAELEAMMDVEDEVMEEAEEPEVEAEADAESEAPDEPSQDTQKESMTVENGRWRGRRKIMKKRTVRDEEGYLVTKEEAVWESFSEDEPVAKKAKTTQPAPATNKKAGKPGQGNIMSFFAKK